MPIHDYDQTSVRRLTRTEAKSIYLDDAVPQFDNDVEYADQRKADKDHPAYGLDKKADDDD